MAAEGEHGRILAAAAKTALAPHGFWRKGRSRLWFADRGFWLAVVEFQPSGFSKGSYLNCCAHWFWSPMPDVLALNYFVRVSGFVGYERPQEFETAAHQLAAKAVAESERQRALFATVADTAAVLVEQERSFIRDGRGGGWTAFDAAVASALAGDMKTGLDLFRLAQDSLVSWRPDFAPMLAPFAEAIGQHDRFRLFMETLVDGQRAGYGLPSLGRPLT